MAARYVRSVPIRFSDLDTFGHVNHAKYLTYCEDHRTVMFADLSRSCGSGLFDRGFVVARIECDYQRPMQLADREVEVACGVEAMGTASLTLRYDLATNGNRAASVRTVVVFTSNDRSRPLTESERSWLARYLLPGDAAISVSSTR